MSDDDRKLAHPPGSWVAYEKEPPKPTAADFLHAAGVDTADPEVQAEIVEARNQLLVMRIANVTPEIVKRIEHFLADHSGTRALIIDAEASIDMLLWCPVCSTQHVDGPDPADPEWTNPPHKSHKCRACGHIWRPSDVTTNGVAAIQTKGALDGSPFPMFDVGKLAEVLRTESNTCGSEIRLLNDDDAHELAQRLLLAYTAPT